MDTLSGSRPGPGSPDFEACVVDAMKTWVFKAPRGGGDDIVNYPWVFKPED